MTATAAISSAQLVTGFNLSQKVRTESVQKQTAQESVVPDEILFQQAAKGNSESLGLLITRYEKILFGLLVRMTGDRHLADDLFQDTFLHAMRASATYNQKMRFKPWITAIAVNLVRDDARKRKVRGEVELSRNSNSDETEFRMPEPVSSGEKPDECAERRDEEVYVWNALKKLTALEREVVLLHFYNGMTLEETGHSLQVPLGTVKSRLHGALTRLWGILELSEL